MLITNKLCAYFSVVKKAKLLVYSGFSVWLKFTVGYKYYGIYKISTVVVLTTVAYNNQLKLIPQAVAVFAKSAKTHGNSLHNLTGR